jgi:DDE superfamily endonuclease
MMFGKHRSQLSEIFWEIIEHFLAPREHLIIAALHKEFLAATAARYAQAIHVKSYGLVNSAGFTDGTVIGIARPGDADMQQVAYNGHERKHAIKFQAATSPDGVIVYAAGQIEGRRHDWTLLTQSAQEIYEEAMNVKSCLKVDNGLLYRTLSLCRLNHV